MLLDTNLKISKLLDMIVAVLQTLDGRTIKCNFAKYQPGRGPPPYRGGYGRGGFRGDFRGGYRGGRCDTFSFIFRFG